MTDFSNKLYSWLENVDPANDIDWYEHVTARDFTCGCKPWQSYCVEWQEVLNPSINKVGTFWIHTNSTGTSNDMLLAEANRRKYVVLNAWEGSVAKTLKAYNPNIKCFVYKCASSTRSYDTNSNWQLLPAGVSYQWANANRPNWFLTNASTKQRIQWSYSDHWQMDVGNPEYQDMWANNVAEMKNYGFDGVWVDNCLWRRLDYNAYPAQYPTDESFRNAYKFFISRIKNILQQNNLLVIGNLNGARLITGGWESYLDAGLDGAWDEFWLSVDNTGNNLLSEYSQGWSRVVNQVSYAESKNKIALVQPHFPVGNTRAYDYTLASYLSVSGSKSAFTEVNSTDAYGSPTAWHVEYDWNFGKALGPRYQPTANPNVWKRDFVNGTVIISANTKDQARITVPLNGTYYDRSGTGRTSVSLVGCTGAVLRK